MNILCNESEKITKTSLFTLLKWKYAISLTAKISGCFLGIPLFYEFKTFLTSGNETTCLTEMKKEVLTS